MKATVIATCFTIIFCLFCSGYCEAQYSISGKVINETNEPAANADVLLLRAKDSVLVKGVITNHSGNYLFENIPGGNYLISSTFSGFKEVYTRHSGLKETITAIQWRQ